MLDKVILDSLDKNHRDMAVSGLRSLISSGALEIQKKQLLEQLTSGYAEESDEALATRVREYRRRIGVILSVEELVSQLSEEK